jgi:hypothetical protein
MASSAERRRLRPSGIAHPRAIAREKKEKGKCAQSRAEPQIALTAPQSYRHWTYVWRPTMVGPGLFRRTQDRA